MCGRLCWNLSFSGRERSYIYVVWWLGRPTCNDWKNKRSGDTVDENKTAPIDMVDIPLFTRFYAFQRWLSTRFLNYQQYDFCKTLWIWKVVEFHHVSPCAGASLVSKSWDSWAMALAVVLNTLRVVLQIMFDNILSPSYKPCYMQICEYTCYKYV